MYIYKITDTHVHTHAYKHTHACVENFVMWQMQLKCLQAFCRFMARLAGKIPPVPPHLSPLLACCLPDRPPPHLPATGSCMQHFVFSCIAVWQKFCHLIAAFLCRVCCNLPLQLHLGVAHTHTHTSSVCRKTHM